MLDLQEEWIDISDTENENESKIFNQYLVKLQLNDELELIKKQSNVDGCQYKHDAKIDNLREDSASRIHFQGRG